MHSGLKPSVRGLKGLGFNRALPSAFGFGNALHGDGVNDFLTIPGMVGTNFPGTGSFEFWINRNNANSEKAILGFQDSFGTIRGISINTGGDLRMNLVAPASFSEAGPSPVLPLGKTHGVITWDSSSSWLYVNGGASIGGSTGLLPNGVGNAFSVLGIVSLTRIGCNALDYNFSDFPLDELRLYNRVLSLPELIANYNSGIGENPQNAIGLKLWYQFERFETLDFSTLQDNSDLRLGIRDMSNNNLHAQPNNMDTNPASGTYALKPF